MAQLPGETRHRSKFISWDRWGLLGSKCPLEPSPGEVPMPVGAARRDIQCAGNLRNGHAHKVAQLDDCGRGAVLSRKFIEGVMHGKYFVRGSSQFDLGCMQFLRRLVPAPLQT